MDNSTVTYAKFLGAIPFVAKDRDQRYGQALFNLLSVVRPGLAEAIRATPLDPFYREEHEIPPELWTMLVEKWDDYA